MIIPCHIQNRICWENLPFMLALDFPQFAKSLSTFLLVVVWPTSSCSLCKIPSFANLNVIFNFPSFFQLASLISWYFHCNENSSFLACFMMYSLFVTLPFPRKVSKVSPVWVSSSLGAIPLPITPTLFLMCRSSTSSDGWPKLPILEDN